METETKKGKQRRDVWDSVTSLFMKNIKAEIGYLMSYDLSIASASQEKIKEWFTFNYRTLFAQTKGWVQKNINTMYTEHTRQKAYARWLKRYGDKYAKEDYEVEFARWFERNAIKYEVLKLRRWLAYMHKRGYIKVDGGVNYSAKDKYFQFPMFGCQKPDIVPTKKLINVIMKEYLDIYCKQNNIKDRDARSLRLSLIKKEGVSTGRANQLIDLYKELLTEVALNEVVSEK